MKLTVTREQLYEEVWGKPMRTIAKDFGISDYDIAKACRLLQVPRPARGHWMKQAAGKHVAKPPLPARDSSIPEVAVLKGSMAISKPNAQKTGQDNAVIVAVPEDLRSCHPLVSATKKSLESVKPDETHLCRAMGNGTLQVRVSRSSMHRALRLLEALIRAAERLGWKVESMGERPSLDIIPAEDAVSLVLSEKIDRSEVPRPPGEQYWYKRYNYTATGRLVIEITDYLQKGMRSSWSDGKIQRLENHLSEVLSGVGLAGDNLRQRRLEREEREQVWAEERRLRQEMARRIKIEKQTREEMLSSVAGWEKAEAINRFCDELVRRASAQTEIFSPPDVKRWVGWARAVAGNMNPFENGFFQRALKHADLDAGLDCTRDVPNW
jgi:hypothetical protein